MIEEEEGDPRDQEIARLIDVLLALGYANPERDAEIADPETGRVLAVAEAFWPESLQLGLGSPVVLELDPHEADRTRLEELGYEISTSIEALEHYAVRRAQIASGLQADE